jgi:chemotaxis protein histidine kinase CheA
MTGGLLDFFVLEATEYVDQLDGLATKAGTAPPEAVPFARAARGLRGAATMAKLNGIAEVAQGLERLARQLRDGQLRWDPAIRGTAIAAIDDIKILVRGARSWGDAEDRRAAARARELEQVAPKQPHTVQRGKGAAFLAGAAAEAAAGLLTFAEQPGSLEEFAETMRRVRALRGVAALTDLPPLAEVVDAIDAAAKPIELHVEDATAERRRLFRTAARVLLEGGEAVRQGGLPPTDSNAVREFAYAAETLRAGERDTDDVVPITALLPEGDPASHITAAANPPTTAAQRFRLEVVSQAEHLRRLVADGRAAVDAATRDRVGRELRAAVRTLSRAAESFQAKEIAQLFQAAERGAAALDHKALWVLDEAGTELSRQESGPEAVVPRFLALAQRLAGTPPAPVQSAPARQRRSGNTPDGARPVTPAVADAAQPAARASTPNAAPASAARPNAGASGAALRDLLASGIAGLAPLETTRLAEPVLGEDDDVVPIEELLFRGREALDRALRIGEQLRGTAAPPDPATLSELYDLLQLAAAD